MGDIKHMHGLPASAFTEVTSQTMLKPGSTIGMLGGGQLGRMAAIAAAVMGYKIHVFSPSANGPCAQVSALETVAPYEDEVALRSFADAVDVVTLEFENIPLQTVRFLRQFVPVWPDDVALEVAQDRIREKAFFTSCGVDTVKWLQIADEEDVANARKDFQFPAILKTSRFGYDGKVQI